VAVTLVLGGARSGKSDYGEKLVAGMSARPVCLATAEAGDDEMARRIAEHRARRGPAWRLIEEPVDIAEVIAAAEAGSALLVDCLTLWLSNLMARERDIASATGGLVAALGEARVEVVLVANEVGLSIVPENALARRFRDEAGRLNQAVASAADDVVFMVAGLPLPLKRDGRPVHE
jgi:adenosylcobinamide kinase/adenosylcobinamide-phosphate guanylyltransferase